MTALIVFTKTSLRIFAKAFCTSFLLLTSLYCLLAFLPYTYYALIKAPVYEWMPWFADHYSGIYWVVFAGAAAAYWRSKKSWWYRASFGILAAAGTFITARPFMADLQSDFHAYLWSAAALAPLLFLAVTEVMRAWPQLPYPRSLNIFPAVCSALAVAPLTLIAAKMQMFGRTNSMAVHQANVDIGFWVIVTHAVLALVVVSGLNLICVLAAKSASPRRFSYGVIFLVLFTALDLAIAGFLDSALNFSGLPARIYAALLSATLVLVGFSVAAWLQRTISSWRKVVAGRNARAMLALPVIAAVSGVALFLTPRVAEWDWNGVFQCILTLAIWLAFSFCFYLLWPRSRTYSVPAILAILLLTIFSYKSLQATEIFWARPLGATDDAIGRSLERYASENVSFQLAHHLLGNAPEAAKCGELCRILREYTNVRNASTTAEVKLSDPLIATTRQRPNIFVIVVDSMRPDYLGAYNPKVDFTPNIDALARDSAVFRNAYTQYAGTTLSEPAIWSGAMLLHAHYLRPFHNVNSLEKLTNVDGYQMIVSYDTVLKEILSPSDDLTKLDTGRPWNEFEFCSTVNELTQKLASRTDKSRPVFFYAQPMNVHQFARNQQATWRTTDWSRPGFSRKVALEVHQVDECMGKFLTQLKTRGLYDNSIIVLASDHGDALGDFGRHSHSYLIYPEVMHVPLIVHLPKALRAKTIYDESALSALTDITPSLYYLLGHKPGKANPMYGQSLFADNKKELDARSRHELFLASDEVAVYGLLEEGGRYMYATYDSPARSYLFDLERDPNAEHNILTDTAKKKYDQRIIDYLKMIANFYGYKPGVGSLLASSR